MNVDWEWFNAVIRLLSDHDLFLKGVMALIATLCIWLLARLVETGVSKRIEDRDIRYRIRKITDLVSYGVTLVVVMTIFSEQMTNLAVIIGALSVGIGFALREVIQSLIGWTALSFWGMYKTGDRIQMGVMGDVIDISPLTTTVMECGGWVKSDLYNGRVVRLSNSLVFRENVYNYTTNFPFLWDEIVVPVRTESDHQKARELIVRAAKIELVHIIEKSQREWRRYAHHHLVKEVSFEPTVSMSFDANWIEFTLRYVVDHRNRRATKDKLFTHILTSFEHTRGRVQIASNHMRVSELPEMDMTIGHRPAAQEDAKPGA